MDPRNLQKQREPEEPRFLSFPHLPDDAKLENGMPALNKYSSTLTTGHNFPGAQVRYSRCHDDSSTSVTNGSHRLGNAVRSWCAITRSHEDAAPCGDCKRLVGG
jgi:hypothetical protein